MAINLTKGGDEHRFNLVKDAPSITIHANLDWAKPEKKGFFSKLFAKDIDLDLGCFYELTDGTKGVIQPLGNSFGAKNQLPYIFLDKDDRSGGLGENMYVYKPEFIRRILFFALLYDGANDFRTVGGHMSFKISTGDEVTLKLDNPTSNSKFCAAAIVENINGELAIRKEERYFQGHPEADRYYGFGFKWVAGSK